MRNIPTYERFIAESASTLDFSVIRNMSKAEATKMVQLHYPHGLTWDGGEFFEAVYMEKIIPCAVASLFHGKEDDFQESYLGYILSDDLFVSGFDTWGDGRMRNVAFIKYDGVTAKIVRRGPKSSPYEGMMYGGKRGGVYNQLHKDYHDLVDIRLD